MVVVKMMDNLEKWKIYERELVKSIKSLDIEKEADIRKQMRKLIDCSCCCVYANECKSVCNKKAFVFYEL